MRLFGEDVAVRAEVTYLPGVSGHADKNGLLDWMLGFTGRRPAQVFVNHGDDTACTAFAETLKEHGFEAMAPYSGTEYDLAAGAFVTLTKGVRVKPKEAAKRPRPMNEHFAALIAAAERLLEAARGAEGRPNKLLRGWTERINKITKDMKG